MILPEATPQYALWPLKKSVNSWYLIIYVCIRSENFFLSSELSKFSSTIPLKDFSFNISTFAFYWQKCLKIYLKRAPRCVFSKSERSVRRFDITKGYPLISTYFSFTFWLKESTGEGDLELGDLISLDEPSLYFLGLYLIFNDWSATTLVCSFD